MAGYLGSNCSGVATLRRTRPYYRQPRHRFSTQRCRQFTEQQGVQLAPWSLAKHSHCSKIWFGQHSSKRSCKWKHGVQMSCHDDHIQVSMLISKPFMIIYSIYFIYRTTLHIPEFMLLFLETVDDVNHLNLVHIDTFVNEEKANRKVLIDRSVKLLTNLMKREELAEQILQILRSLTLLLSLYELRALDLPLAPLV
uniref:Uncharacterized protein n=1 Tax=Heterorhabditis bacteriophora TaxID=37862 RepID=A0A1I7WTN4_HETBA